MNFSVNNNAAKIIEEYVIPNAEDLNIDVHKLSNGATIIDMGVKSFGGWLAAKAFVEIGLGDLGELSYKKIKIGKYYVPAMAIFVDRPTIAEMSSHSAFWRVPYKGKNVNISGPIRSITGTDIFATAVDYRDKHAKKAVGLIQTTEIPDCEFAGIVANGVSMDPKDLYLVVARTGTMVGAIQVCARNIEQTLPSLYDNGFKMEYVIQADAITPMVSIVDDEMIAYGRVNDCLIYGQETNVYVRCKDAEIKALLHDLTFEKNQDVYGVQFQELFARCNNDWTQVPREWDAPCKVNFHNMLTGNSFTTGKIGYATLEKSFLGL